MRTTTTALGSTPTAVAGGGGFARPAAAAMLVTRQTCWQGTPATATSAPPSTRPWPVVGPLQSSCWYAQRAAAACSGRQCGQGMRRGAPRLSRRALMPRCPPTRRKRRGCRFGGGTRWQAGRGGDWVTCLRLLERAAAAADVACDGARLLATVRS
jgi:hypothetical protein